jgi:predicted dienelactone hydrolase
VAGILSRELSSGAGVLGRRLQASLVVPDPAIPELFTEVFDAERQRRIPLSVYSPVGPPRATLVFSVGFGGGREGYGFLARSWAAKGFRVLVVEHVGSNLKVLQKLVTPGMRRQELARLVGERARDPSELFHRPLDLGFVIRQNVGPEERLGLAGHSFGTYTALAAAGAQALLGGTRTRWKPEKLLGRSSEQLLGLVLMSAQPPGFQISAQGYATVFRPTLVMTGTRDHGMPAGTTVADRIRAFHALPPGERLLAVLEGADHMTFAGVGLPAGRFTQAIENITGRFWEAQCDSVRTWASTLPTSEAWAIPVEWEI